MDAPSDEELTAALETVWPGGRSVEVLRPGDADYNPWRQVGNAMAWMRYNRRPYDAASDVIERAYRWMRPRNLTGG